MSRQTKFFIAIVIAFASVTVMSVLADTIYLPIVYRQPTPTATNTPTPTARPPGVYIEEFHPSEYPSDDYLVIINTTDDKVDFTDWFIKAEKAQTSEDSTFTFEDGFKLGVDKTVKVRSSIGIENDSNLYWGLTYSLWWTYPTNCAYLRIDDEEGTIVHKWCVDWEWD
jgi:hypothetical protein